MEINSLIKFGLLGATALFVVPKILGSQEDKDAESGGGGVSWGGNAFFGDSDKGYRGAVAGQESGSKKTSQSGETSFQTITITQPSLQQSPNLVKAPSVQTKKEINSAPIDNYDYAGRSPSSKYSYNPSNPQPIQNSSATQRIINEINETPHPAKSYTFSGNSVISVAPKKTFIQRTTGAIGSFFGGLFR